MARSDLPRVVHRKNHTVITPPHRLGRALVRIGDGQDIDSEAVRCAEAAVASLESQFPDWLAAGCERLDRARKRVVDSGGEPASRRELFMVAHDMRGEAASFGFPLVGRIADSLCDLVEATPPERAIPAELLASHVDSIRAIVRENARGDADEVARTLASGLRRATDEFRRRAEP